LRGKGGLLTDSFLGLWISQFSQVFFCGDGKAGAKKPVFNLDRKDDRIDLF
jgi:hypothetical protein